MAAHAELPEVAADPKVLAAVRAIYEASFSPSARADFASLREEVRSGAVRLFVTRGEDGAAVGFGVTRRLAGVRAHLLEYFAVANDRRGAGVGGELLERLLAALQAEGSADRLLLEVEPADSERSDTTRRIAFYERHRARVVGCAPDYRVPSFAGPEELHYLLMWAPLADGVEEPRGEELQAIVRTLLVDVYELEPDAPLVRDVLGALAC